MRECVSRITEEIRAKIMTGEVKTEPEESPCRECQAQGCCEMVQCSMKSKQNKSLDVLRAQVLKHGIPEEIMVDNGERYLSAPPSNAPKNSSNI